MRALSWFTAAIALIAASAATPVGSEEVAAGDRNVLLDRFVEVLPPPNSAEATRLAQIDEAKQQLAQRNPGREAQSAAAFDAYHACVSHAMDSAAPLLVRQAADQSLSDAELADFVDFYSGARYTRYLELSEREVRGERLTREEARIVRGVDGAPETRRFLAALNTASAEFTRTEAGQRVLGPCITSLQSDIQAHGLRWF